MDLGESRIGSTPDAVISATEWSEIEVVCFQGVHTLGHQEQSLITAFGIISYLLLSIVTISKIVVSIVDDSSDIEVLWLRKFSFGDQQNGRYGSYLRLLVELITAITLVIQFWAFFRVRGIQSVMIRATGESFSDGQWTFGQVVAILVFVPVAVEVVFVWKKQSLFLKHEI